MSDTRIPWADRTWNPITGCSPISEGCQNCYAMRMFGRNLWKYDSTPRLHPNRLLDPPELRGQGKRIFVGSMTDIFHEDVLLRWVVQVMQIIRNTPQHTLMMLTKRPAIMRAHFDNWGQYKAPDNLWLGFTAENQTRYNERMYYMHGIISHVRFVSCEPLLGEINLGSIRCKGAEKPYLDWVIAGPETGPGARPCKHEWIEYLHEQCRTAGIPFFDKRDNYLAREFPAVKGIE